MKKITVKFFGISLCLWISFILWTLAVLFIDVQAIGPHGSCVGFATLNRFVHELTGVHFTLYAITDWLGLVPLAVCFGFVIVGLVQWITRKHFLKVDYTLLILGCFYLLVMAIYLFFETVVINYRPVLINGFLEVSYPSSTTLLVMSVMPTTILQIRTRVKNPVLNKCLTFVLLGFIFFMVLGRLVSGVHWITDIIGSILLCSAMVTLYCAVASVLNAEKKGASALR